MTDPAILRARLAEAEAALHALTLGQKAQTVSYDGKSVTYTAANIGDLRSYILQLKAQLGDMPRRAASFRFVG
jgi:hypothetical protein